MDGAYSQIDNALLFKERTLAVCSEKEESLTPAQVLDLSHSLAMLTHGLHAIVPNPVLSHQLLVNQHWVFVLLRKPFVHEMLTPR